MKLYKLHNDLSIIAKSDREFCQRVFWRSIFAKEKTTKDFVDGWALRIRDTYNLTFVPNTTKYEDFVADLVRLQLLTVSYFH